MEQVIDRNQARPAHVQNVVLRLVRAKDTQWTLLICSGDLAQTTNAPTPSNGHNVNSVRLYGERGATDPVTSVKPTTESVIDSESQETTTTSLFDFTLFLPRLDPVMTAREVEISCVVKVLERYDCVGVATMNQKKCGVAEKSVTMRFVLKSVILVLCT